MDGKKKDANKADAILIGRYFLDHFSNEGFWVRHCSKTKYNP